MIGFIGTSVTSSQYHCTTAHIKSPNHTLRLHRLTSSVLLQLLFCTPTYRLLLYFFSFGILLTYEDASRTCITENIYHVTATQPVHWRAGYCLQKTYVTCQLPTVVVTSLHLHGSVFTEPLPRNGLHKPVVLLLQVGSCMCCRRCLAMDILVTIL
jgi:hypothetical protein